MTLKKLTSLFAMLAISILMFTACDDTDDPNDPDDPVGTVPNAITNLKAGQIGGEVIRIQWTPSSSSNVTSYNVKVTNLSVDTTYTLMANENSLELGGAVSGTEFTFTVTAVNAIGSSTPVSITWATALHFTKNDNNDLIKVYGSSSDYGSGLILYDAAGEAPKIAKIASAANWNLGLFTKDSKIIFGSANTLGYSGTFTNSATITDPVDVDTDDLNGLLMDKNLSNLTFGSKTIDLKTNTNSKGIVFFAKAGTHYAKVIILKKDGSFLQDAGTNEYVQVYVSYQSKDNVPYAKIFAGK